MAARRRIAAGLAMALLLAARLLAAQSVPVLRVGTSDDYPPFASRGGGFDVDVAGALAADLGMRIEWVRFRWPDLAAMVLEDRFDVAMSGVTWRPERAVIGWMSRAVAQGGPCVVGDPSAGLVAVNRGGVLERWARRRFGADALMPIDDNLSLPVLLEGGAASAFVTDSFEVASLPLARGGARRCEPPRDRKVYWVAPAGAKELGPRIDAWLAANEPRLDELRRRWLGGSARRDGIDDVVDRMARRLELMPAVAAWKRTHARAIEDREHEARVLAQAEDQASAAGLDPASVRRLFEVQIDLAKAIERRDDDAPSLDLDTQLRPALWRLGDEIVAGLGAVAPLAPSSLAGDRLAPFGALLEDHELARLRAALLEVEPIHR